jgi:hypothetical protein
MNAKMHKKRIVCLAVAEVLISAEPSSALENDPSLNAEDPPHGSDFPEAHEDPAQSAELELQHDA